MKAFTNSIFSFFSSPEPRIEKGEDRRECDSPSSSLALAAQRFFQQEREEGKLAFAAAKEWSAFSSLPPSLLNLVVAEKARLLLSPTHRILVDGERKVVRGQPSCLANLEVDETHPVCCAPFRVEGYWIPESEGEFFSTLSSKSSSLVRETAQGREVLFVIHPRSNALFAPLREKYQATKVALQALALSSFRTLIVAYENSFVCIKVSLDQEIGDVHRILFRRECAVSVANSFFLIHLPLNIECLAEVCSFVVTARLLNSDPIYADVKAKGAGMICRELPKSVLESEEVVIPLFALLGKKNLPLLKALIAQSGLSPTVFVLEKILKPLTQAFIDALFDHNTALEVHAQNSLIAIDASKPGEIKTRPLYRDMGGVNSLLAQQEEKRKELPPALQSCEHYYFDNHIRDAACDLDRIVNIASLFTEQFFNDEALCSQDSEFSSWKEQMIERGFSQNWTYGADESLPREIPIDRFYQYGYFEKKLAAFLLNDFFTRGLFFGQINQLEALRSEIGVDLANGQDTLNPATYSQDWFINLIKILYQP